MMDCSQVLKGYFKSIQGMRKELLVPVISITTATATLLSYYYYTSHKRKKRQQRQQQAGIREIPMPSGRLPYVGHMFSLGTAPHKTVSAWHKKHGPIIQIKMGVQTWIFMDDPELCHKVFVTHGACCSSRPHSSWGSAYSMNGKGVVFAQPNHGWRESRSAALVALAAKQIDDKYILRITEQSETLAKNLIASTEKEGSTNPLKYLELCNLNVIFQSGFGEGKQFTSIDDPAFLGIIHVNETLMEYSGFEYTVSDFLPIFSVIDCFMGPRDMWRKFLTTERDPLYRQLVRDALVSEGPNFVKTLHEEFSLTEDEKLVFMSDLTAAGSDTTSKTLEWMIAILCNHPEVQQTAADEIDRFIQTHDGQLPAFKDREELPYCISVMKECMRFRPTGFIGVPHMADQEFVVDGYLIPKGAILQSNMDSLHKNANFYPMRPTEFVPERFLHESKTMHACANGRVSERDHFIFGWGRRVCPAVYLAEAEIFCAFVQILARCFIRPIEDDKYPNIENGTIEGLVISPDPFKVKFVRRTTALSSE